MDSSKLVVSLPKKTIEDYFNLQGPMLKRSRHQEKSSSSRGSSAIQQNCPTSCSPTLPGDASSGKFSTRNLGLNCPLIPTSKKGSGLVDFQSSSLERKPVPSTCSQHCDQHRCFKYRLGSNLQQQVGPGFLDDSGKNSTYKYSRASSYKKGSVITAQGSKKYLHHDTSRQYGGSLLHQEDGEY